ncbi:hypothetical protein BN7_5581 [Wickerhamomyces ciferrii]|uniref:Uncharacterized protein n=1 Tax=Wickerhamomyces ciferrii (strain ATCC 14091 / BCRC 22168 / CBS 111 / JCM 3599 / NBRC 0793 / NRRL Y-1031 F-60-10) TaxID=1206466 RepID=K0KWY0_WICCF|nr:uncharacterized protein BN7_5581 [Wickerhamomyces ciferrii]CCH45994.1 hypothetical protein BN7_5581 [Wickerhamomyces ciferrii]
MSSVASERTKRLVNDSLESMKHVLEDDTENTLVKIDSLRQTNTSNTLQYIKKEEEMKQLSVKAENISRSTEEQNVVEDIGDITIAGIFKDGFSVTTFIDGDEVLQFLSEGYDVLNPGNDPVHLEKFRELTWRLSDSKEELEDMAFEELEKQIFKLNNELENIYQRLLHFSRILVSLTPDEMVETADILIENQEYYEQVMSSDSLTVPSPLHKRLLPEEDNVNSGLAGKVDDVSVGTVEEDADQVVDQGLVGPLPGAEQSGSAELQSSYKPKDAGENFKQYWNPDEDYELLQDFLLEDVTGLTPTEKLEDLVQAAGAVKKVIHKVEDAVEKTRLIYKVFKAKKILKSKSSIAIFVVIKTIEKIKRIIRHIKYCIIRIIVKFIKNFPFNVLWRLKVLIRLFIKIILQIIWEIRYLLTEILYRLYFLAKRLKKIPIYIILYLKKLSEKKSWILGELLSDGFDDDDDYWGEWDAWKDFDDSWNENKYDDDWDDKKFMKFEAASTGDFKSPEEIEKIFEGFFDASDLKKINKDRFNFDIVYDFDYNDDNIRDPVPLNKRSTEFEDTNTTWSNSTTGYIATNLTNSNATINNSTSFDSMGTSLATSIAGPYFLACLLVIITKIVFKFI